MDPSPKANQQEIVLDVFGQQMITIFTQICFCFPVSDASLYPGIIEKLKEGLKRLAAKFPWLAGQVVNEGADKGNTGIFKIKPLGKIPRMTVKDLRDDDSMPSMDDLRRAGFPMSMLDEKVIAPRKTSSGPPSGENIAEVFQLQANLIRGGIILTFLGQHQAMDGTGQGHVMHFFSKACRDESFTNEEVSTGNFAPQNVVPLLDGETWNPGPELHFQIIPPIPTDPRNNKPSPVRKNTWAQFSFPATSLNALKSLAMETLPSSLSLGYISTDDALSAFIWQSITRARLPRLTSTSTSTIARAVDVRNLLDIPSSHPGFMHTMTYHTFPIHDLTTDLPLGVIASHLRAAVDPKTSTLEYDTRSFGTLISRTPDKNKISLIARMDMSTDIMLNSWAKLDAYALDFGLRLGTPEAVRRPKFVDAFEGLLYLMPRREDGEIGFAVCLRSDDLERLIEDRKFAKYAVHVG